MLAISSTTSTPTTTIITITITKEQFKMTFLGQKDNMAIGLLDVYFELFSQTVRTTTTRSLTTTITAT